MEKSGKYREKAMVFIKLNFVATLVNYDVYHTL